jgi:ketosteroid isomerase-like protein
MSRENVELVKSVYGAFERGGLDAISDFYDPFMDYRAIQGAVDDAGVLQGFDAFGRYLEDWIQSFDELRVEPEELIDAGDQVVVVVHLKGRIKASDAEVDMRFGLVCTVREGKIVRGREYATREEALHAAGLPASASAGSE